MTEKIEVILLAAGRGSRLRPITDHIPKCLVPICGIPLLQIWLDALTKLPRINKVHINTSYMSDQVEKFIGEYDSDKIKIHHEEELLGTAGTTNKIMNEIVSETVMIAHADNLSVFDIEMFCKAYQTRETDQIGTMMTFETNNPCNCGIVYSDAANRITGYIEKPCQSDCRIANAAIYLVNSHQYKKLACDEDTDFSKDFVSREFKRLNTYFNNILHIDVGSIPDFLRAQKSYYALSEKKCLS